MRTFVGLLYGLFALISIPIMALNFIGGIVGGIWLLILGRWADFGFGLAVLIGGAFLISLALAPGLIAGVAAASFIQKGKIAPAVPLGAIALGWTYAIVTGWCLSVFWFLLGRSEGHTVPYLLWAYANATGPWMYMASKESKSDPQAPAVITTFGAQLGCIALMVATLAGWSAETLLGMPPVFLPFIGIALVFQLLVLITAREPASY